MKRESERTSITDQPAYRAFCERAAKDDAVFVTFRRHPLYIRTMEHVSPELGAAYLDVIREQTPELLTDPARIMANDRFGGPLLHDIPGFGPIAPTTLRYLKVLSDLIVLFGRLDRLRIVEIGPGYGGQCRLIMDRFRVGRYTLVDLPTALKLAERYLTSFGLHDVEFRTMDDLPDGAVDLVISNYAFSECARPVQDLYAERIVRRAPAAYITCNFVNAVAGIASYSRDELLGLHGGARFVPERPLTHPDNAVLTWGSASALLYSIDPRLSPTSTRRDTPG